MRGQCDEQSHEKIGCGTHTVSQAITALSGQNAVLESTIVQGTSPL